MSVGGTVCCLLQHQVTLLTTFYVFCCFSSFCQISFHDFSKTGNENGQKMAPLISIEKRLNQSQKIDRGESALEDYIWYTS